MGDINQNISLNKVKMFLKRIGYDWNFSYWKENLSTFCVAQSFEDVKSSEYQFVVLELYNANKIFYFKYRINEDKFQKILTKSAYICNVVVEDYSDDWRTFLNNDLNLQM